MSKVVNKRPLEVSGLIIYILSILITVFCNVGKYQEAYVYTRQKAIMGLLWLTIPLVFTMLIGITYGKEKACEQSAKPDESDGTRVKLIYFKESGKYYTEATYCSDFGILKSYEIYNEVRFMNITGTLPGLQSGRWDYTILVSIENGVPAVIN